MKTQKSSIKFLFIDKIHIFVDEINYLIDMIVLFVIIIMVFAAILFLRGEGSTYGKGNAGADEKKRFGVSDRNFFL